MNTTDKKKERFGCELLFMSNLGTMHDIPAYMFLGGVVITTMVDIEQHGLNTERDIFKPIVDDAQYIKDLEKGTYKMFVVGNVYLQPVYQDDGTELSKSMELVFEETEVRIVPLLDFKPETQVLLDEEDKDGQAH